MSQFFNTSTSGSPSNPVSPTNGGTGVSNPPAHTVPVAEGSAPFNFVGPGAVGTVLIGNGASADPSFSGSPSASGQFLAANGTQAAPGYAFTNSTNSGIYLNNTNNVNITSGGNTAATFTSVQTLIDNGQLVVPNGAAGTPSLVFFGSQTTGLSSLTNGQLDFTAATVLISTYSTTSITNTVPTYAPNGSVTTPSYSFTNDANSGFYYAGSGTEFDVAVNGGQTVRFLSTQTIVNNILAPLGGFAPSYTATAVSLAMTNTMYTVGVTSTAAARTITLPNPASLNTGQKFTVKDESGAAGTNNITISGNGANIDGAATKVISTNFGSVDLYFNGTNFFVI